MYSKKSLTYIFHQKDLLLLFQTTTLGIQRSDYMIDIKGNTIGLKQVELNTIAAGNPGLNNRIKGFHQ